MDPLLWLVPAAFVAGFIDSMVGGGGVITLPAIIASGVPPHAAIATNKVAGAGASGVASWQYARAGLLRPRLAWTLFPVAVAASVAGAYVVLRIPEHVVLAMVAGAVLVMVAYVLARPGFGRLERVRPAGVWALGGLGVWVTAAAFYDGMLGPGTGTLLLFGIIALLGVRFLPAAAHGRVFNFGSSIGALGYFAAAGVVEWRIGLGMMVGTVAGAYIGSRSGIRHGDRWVRPLFVLMASVLLARVLWQLP